MPDYALSQSSSYNYFEPEYQLTRMFGGNASFIGVEAGRQLAGGFSYGAAAHFLVNSVNRSSANFEESVSSLWYAGPRLQYSSQFSNQLSWFGGGTVGLGSTNYTEAEFGTAITGGFLIGFRPEMGIRYKFSDVLQLNVGLNAFFARIQSRSNISGAPAVRVGIRLGR
ncbi:hypothetical protein DDZ15_10875 [Rhodohalobacter mucosus]|uniref:Outer membrane protein beta-barrel domain-containing protein n=2 Tax=Rhodohalobacter mucosus TaxID=2079485 RepID=A0A316U0Q3_9BACT|nr:hypothetical protein DDZ15_10875 [Rhodohalobacter mucosus]